MLTAACPKCNEHVTIPDSAPTEAIVRCPLCQAEYGLREALEKLPPALIVVSLPAPQYSPVSELPRAMPAMAVPMAAPMALAPSGGAAEESFTLDDVEEQPAEMVDEAVAEALSMPPVDEAAEEIVEKWDLTPPAEEGAEMFTAPPAEAADDMFVAPPAEGMEGAPEVYEDIPMADPDEVAATPEGFNFEEAAAPSALAGAVPSSPVKPRPPKKGGGILQLAGVLIGGLMAIPLAQLVLWWLPGDWARDFGLGAPVAKVLPSIVPEKFRGGAIAKAPDAPSTPHPQPQPPAETPKPAAPADKIDDALANASNTNQKNLHPEGKPGEELPTGIGNGEKKPAEEMPEDKNAKPNDLAVDPPAVVPDPGLTVEIKPTITPEKIDDPFGKGPTKPEVKPEPSAEPKTEPKPDPFDEPKAEPKGEPKPTPKPDPFDEPKPEVKPEPEVKPAPVPAVAALTGDATTVVKDALPAKADDLAKSLTATAEVEKLWDALGADAPKEERGKIAREMRETLATLGQAATYLDAEAAKDPAQAEKLHHQLAHLASEPMKVQVISAGAAGWLASSSRTSNGVVLAGTVKEVKKAGDVYETQLELLTPKGGTFVALLGTHDPGAALAAGTRVIVAGAIIDEPATRVTGYSGEAKQAVWAGQVVPLAEEKK